MKMTCCQLFFVRNFFCCQNTCKARLPKITFGFFSYCFSFAAKSLDLLQVPSCLAANHWPTLLLIVLLIKCLMHTIAIRSAVGFCSPESVGPLIRPNWFRLSFPSLTLNDNRTQDTCSSRHCPSIDSQGIDYVPVSHFVH